VWLGRDTLDDAVYKQRTRKRKQQNSIQVDSNEAKGIQGNIAMAMTQGKMNQGNE
jgi:hypothetical protein